MLRTIGALTLAAGWSISSAEGYNFSPSRHPIEYLSPSGACRLRVTASTRDGRGPAEYRLTCRSREMWSGQRDHTFLKAALTDEGVVVGYTQTCGDASWILNDYEWMGWPPERQTETHTMSLVVLERDGVPRFRHSIPIRVEPTQGYREPDPNVRDLLFSPQADVVLLRVDEGHKHDDGSWWAYRASTGESLPRFAAPTGDPTVARSVSEVVATGVLVALVCFWADVRRSRLVAATVLATATAVVWCGPSRRLSSYRTLHDVRSIPGTPLLLVQWNAGRTPDAALQRFLVTTTSGEVVWTHEVRSHDEGTRILDTGPAGAFAIAVPDRSERALFQVEHTADRSWRVHETARRVWTDVAPADPFSALTAIEARPLGDFIPGAGEPAPPDAHLHGVDAFDIDNRGRIAFVRDDGALGFTFVLVDGEGVLIREVLLPFRTRPSRKEPVVSAWAGVEAWVAAATNSGEAFYINAANGQARPLLEPRTSEIEAIQARAGRGFLLRDIQRSPVDGIATRVALLFDTDGRLERRIEDRGRESRFIGAVALSGGGWARNGYRSLVFLDESGVESRRVPLGELAKDEETNLLFRDAGGGCIMTVFQVRGGWVGSARYIRIRPDGSISNSLHLRDGSGAPLEVRQLQGDPQGRVWASNGQALLRLSHDGAVQRAFGPDPTRPSVNTDLEYVVDSRGHLHATDIPAGIAYTFDSTGARIGNCRAQTASRRRFLIAPDGSPWFASTPDREQPWHLARCGASRGFDTPAEPTHLQAEGQAVWSVGSGEIQLFTGRHKARTIDRRPDGFWQEQITGSAMAPDGSLAVESSPDPEWALERDAPRAISIYGPNGEPRHTLDLPKACRGQLFAYDGADLFLWDRGMVKVLHKDGRPRQRIALPARGFVEALVPQLAGPGEIWLIDKKARRVHRFERPAPQSPGPSPG